MKSRLLLVITALPVLAAAQTGAIAPVPRQQPLSNSGLILGGSCMYSYAAGTTNPQATYSDSTLVTPNTNPIILDSSGRLPAAYMSAVSYKFVFGQKTLGSCPGTPGTVIWSQDNVYDFGQIFKSNLAGSSGAGLVGYQFPAGVAETVQSALRAGGPLAENFCSTAGTDKSGCLNAAISVGGTVRLQPGTYILQTATLTIPDSTHVFCAGTAATTISATGAFPAVTFLNSQNSSIEGCTISSVNDGVLIRSTNGGHSNQNLLLRDIAITAVGDGFAGVHADNTACCNYFTTFDRVFINGGSPAPSVGTRKGYSFTFSGGGAAGYNLLGVWIGGRITNVLQGIVGGLQFPYVFGTEFDGMTDGASGGIGIHIQTASGYGKLIPRIEGGGGSVDKFWQFDAGSVATDICSPGNSISPSQGTDAGSGNSVSCGDGSGLLTPYNHNPLELGNLTVASTYSLSLPGSTSQQFNMGGLFTGAQMDGLSYLATIKLPNTAFGGGLAMIEDSGDRAAVVLKTHDYNGTSTGRECSFDHTGIAGCALAGGTGGAPITLGTAAGSGKSGVYIPPIAVSALLLCSDSTIDATHVPAGTRKAVSDANSVTFNDAIAGGGTNHVDAYCDSTANGWRVR